MSADYYDRWVCVFPGKMGISWKHAYPYAEPVSKAEADAAAEKNCNVVAVPYALFERYKEYERRMVVAERVLQQCQSNRLFLSVAHPNFGSARIATSLSSLSFEARSSDPLSSGSSGVTDPTVP
jgi:hypothetical protein